MEHLDGSTIDLAGHSKIEVGNAYDVEEHEEGYFDIDCNV